MSKVGAIRYDEMIFGRECLLLFDRPEMSWIDGMWEYQNVKGGGVEMRHGKSNAIAL